MVSVCVCVFVRVFPTPSSPRPPTGPPPGRSRRPQSRGRRRTAGRACAGFARVLRGFCAGGGSAGAAGSTMESGTDRRLDAAAFLGAWRRCDADGKWETRVGGTRRGTRVGDGTPTQGVSAGWVPLRGCPGGWVLCAWVLGWVGDAEWVLTRGGAGGRPPGWVAVWARVRRGAPADASKIHLHGVLRVFRSPTLPPRRALIWGLKNPPFRSRIAAFSSPSCSFCRSLSWSRFVGIFFLKSFL